MPGPDLTAQTFTTRTLTAVLDDKSVNACFTWTRTNSSFLKLLYRFVIYDRSLTFEFIFIWFIAREDVC